jgi:hypothetical protein
MRSGGRFHGNGSADTGKPGQDFISKRDCFGYFNNNWKENSQYENEQDYRRTERFSLG